MKTTWPRLKRSSFRKVNRVKGVDFSEKFKALVDRYNERNEQDVLRSEVLDDFTDEIIDLYHSIVAERKSFYGMGIDFEEKAFYDILKVLAHKYDFEYPEDKLIHLAKEVKTVVEDKAKYTDWSKRDDIKDEEYKEIFEQAENFKRYR